MPRFIKSSDLFITVHDMQKRHIGDFTKEQAEEFFSLYWATISCFLRNGRPIHGMYRVTRYKKPS